MDWKSRQLIKLIAIVAVLVLSGALYWHYGIKLGLDLEGGTHIVLEAQDTSSRIVDPDTMKILHQIIERRIDQLGLAEPRIQRSGERRLIIELPAVDDPEEAIQIVGRTAQLTFRNADNEILMTGEHLKDARADYEQMYRRPIILFELDEKGAKEFTKITTDYLGQVIQIYLDDDWLYSGTVESVISDKGQIQGFASLQDAEQTAMLLREGALPVPLQVEESRTVGPTLGKISIEKSIKAGLAGLILVAAFIIAMYWVPGIAAVLALIVYGVIFVGLLSALKAVLTLPGIAGLILSIGMAVDANIIIFEKIKEDLHFGKTAGAAMNSGFNRAIGTIVDANITTLITALILAYFTSGLVRGFAVTLIIGIVASMFTSIFVTRTFLELMYNFKIFKGIQSFGLQRR